MVPLRFDIMCDQNSDVNEFYFLQGDEQVTSEPKKMTMKRFDEACHLCGVVADYNLCILYILICRYAQSS